MDLVSMKMLAVVPFITPWLFAAGAAATSVPIVIHLLNKRRFRVVIWAAMEFLLAAQRRNARRLKFQRWLLLAVRCLALLILAAAVAQFFLSGNVLGSLLGGGGRVVVIVWDDSASMGYHQGDKPSHFERSRKLLLDWIKDLPSSDKVAIYRASRLGDPLVPKPTLEHSAVRQAVAAALVSDAGTDLAKAMDKASEVLQEREIEKSAGTKHVLVLTDLTRGSMSSAEAEQLKKTAEKLRSLATLRVVDLGQADQRNLGITDLMTDRAQLVAGNPSQLMVSVFNSSERPVMDVPVTVKVDGLELKTKEKIIRIEPGASAQRTIPLTISAAGRHVIEARIDDDQLGVDDTRRLMVNVARELPVLLIEGNREGDVGSVTFLQHTLAPTIEGKRFGPYAPHVISELELARTPLGGYVAVVLGDTGSLDKKTAETLQAYVNDGGMLLVFPGNRTIAARTNEILGEGGVKLLPAVVGQNVKLANANELGAGIQFDPAGYEHPVLQIYRDAVHSGKKVGVLSAQTWQYLKLVVPQDGTVDTILKFSNGDPAVVSRNVGRGVVVQFATSADTSWTSFPAKPSYVEFLHELLVRKMPRDVGGLTLRLGESLDLPADVAPAGSWYGPGKSRVNMTMNVDKQKRARLTSMPLTRAGVYSPADENTQPVVAVNPDRSEVDIRHLAPEKMADAMGLDRSDVVAEPASLETRADLAGGNGSHGGDLGLKLLAMALALFITETILARVFSAYR